jgi:putative transcriptional regulator
VAKALHEVGAMDDVTMREMDKLCLSPVPAYSPAQIRRIRSSTGMSQPVFARLLGVGKSAVAQWEQGERKPSGPALRLLEAFDPKAVSPVYQVRQRQREREIAHATA